MIFQGDIESLCSMKVLSGGILYFNFNNHSWPCFNWFYIPRHQTGKKKKSCLLKPALLIAYLKMSMSKEEISKKILNSDSELGKKFNPARKSKASERWASWGHTSRAAGVRMGSVSQLKWETGRSDSFSGSADLVQLKLIVKLHLKSSLFWKNELHGKHT